jgi:hypothetical protein
MVSSFKISNFMGTEFSSLVPAGLYKFGFGHSFMKDYRVEGL